MNIPHPFAFSKRVLSPIPTQTVSFAEITVNDVIISFHQGWIKCVNCNPFLTPKQSALCIDQSLITLGNFDNSRVLIHFHQQPITPQEQADWFSLRALAMDLTLIQASVIAHASSLAHWHSHHIYCGLCGSKTIIGKEHSRICTSKECQHSQFPRVDPAVIMSVVNEYDEILLGRQASWDENRFSVIAGFLSHGETLEECVAREVLEETSVKVSSVEYIASQPWPFPNSIMLGFRAKAKKQKIVTLDDELEQAIWLSRQQLQTQRDNKEMFISPKFSISRYLIDLWINQK